MYHLLNYKICITKISEHYVQNSLNKISCLEDEYSKRVLFNIRELQTQIMANRFEN